MSKKAGLWTFFHEDSYFALQDGEHTSHNDKVEEAAKVALSHSKVLAVGEWISLF